MAVIEETYTLNTKRSHNFRVPWNRVPSNVRGGFLRVLFHGRLLAGGRDCRLKLRLNKEDTRYLSYSYMSGDDEGRWRRADSWSRESLLLGRTGWGQDADIFLDYLISFQTGYKKCGHGMVTFALSNQKLLKYSGAHGYQSTGSKLDSVTLIVEQGGTLTGKLRVIYELN